MTQTRAFKKMLPAITKLAASVWESRFCLIFPTTELLQLVKQSGEVLHYSRAGWAPKRNKAKGRLTFDSRALTTPRQLVRDIAEKRYGPIVLPQLKGLIHMVLEFDSIVGIDNLVVFKLDWQAAFHLVDIEPKSSLLLVCEIGDGCTQVWNCANFGTVQVPYAFNVVSRLAEMAANALGRVSYRSLLDSPPSFGNEPRATATISSSHHTPSNLSSLAVQSQAAVSHSVQVYVDDTMGTGLASTIDSSHQSIMSVYRLLLGSDSMATDKT